NELSNGEKWDVADKNSERIPSWFFQKDWHKKNFIKLMNRSQNRKSIIINDKLGLGRELWKKLNKSNNSILIEEGENFEKVSNNHFRIKNNNLDDYMKLQERLEIEKFHIDDIFHFSNYNQSKIVEDEKDLKDYQQLGLYSLIYLIKSLKRYYENEKKLELYLISSNANIITNKEDKTFHKGTISGFLKSITVEIPWLQSTHIDLEIDTLKANVERVYNEWINPQYETEIAYRNGKRLVSCLSEAPIGKTKSIPIKKNHVYLVTGGLGGLSTEVSKMLLEEYNAKLIIVGRTPLPDKKHWKDLLQKDTTLSRRIESYLNLESINSNFIYLNGDIANAQFIEKLKTSAELYWNKPLSGIFHLAGIGNLDYHWKNMNEYLVVNEEVHSYEEMFQAKVYGTVLLQQLLKDDLNSLFVAFSSITSFFGAASFSGYAAANSFLDSFCLYRKGNGYENTYCFNWSTWDDIGMSKNNPENMVTSMESNGYEVIQSSDGLKSMLMLLQTGLTQTYIGLNQENQKIQQYFNKINRHQHLKIFYSVTSGTEHSMSKLQQTLKKEISNDESIKVSIHKVDKIPKDITEIGRFEQMVDLNPNLNEKEEKKEDYTIFEKKLTEIWLQVIKRKTIKKHDNFFEIGGDSLKASTVLFHVQKEFNINVSLRDIFNNPTVLEFALFIQKQKKKSYSAIYPVKKEQFYPASSSQKRLYLLHQLQGIDTTYNAPFVYEVKSPIDKKKLQRAINQIVSRHEILRTTIEELQGVIIQRVHESMNINIQEMDTEEQNIESAINKFVAPFDLTKGPLLRVGLINHSNSKQLLVLDTHHAITDGVSMSIFVRELSSLYNGHELPNQHLQYKDFSVWQNKLLKDNILKEQEEYWEKVFSDDIPKLQLYTDYPRPKIKSYKGSSLFFSINKSQANKLNRLASTTETTLYMVLLSAYNILLSKYTGQEDIVVGSPIAGRQHADLKESMGMFVNTLALRNNPKENRTYEAFLKEVKQNALSAYENQDYPFEELVDRLHLSRDLGRNPLFDTMFVLQNMEIEEFQFGEARSEWMKLNSRTSKFDITFTSLETDSGIDFIIEFSTSLFKKDTIKRFFKHYQNILNHIVKDPKIRLSEIDILSQEEKEQMLIKFNDTKAGYPRNKTIHELFEEQVERTPENIAVVADNQKLSYKELNSKSNQLARVLKGRGIKAESIVGIMMERSVNMVIGILGILKAGGAYLPIDPEYPSNRIVNTLNDSRASLLITSKNIIEKLNCKMVGEEINKRDIILFDQIEEQLVQEKQTNLNTTSQPKDLAYIIYTSGSTGRPKGVMIEHQNVTRLLINEKMEFNFNDNDVWTMFHSMCFDFSVWEMYGALLYGGKLIIIPSDTAKYPKAFLEILEKEKVTVLNQTPTAFYNLANEELKKAKKELKLRYVIFGGEALNPGNLKDFKLRYPEVKLVNMYGITETTVHVTFKEITSREIQSRKSCIGKPIPTLTTYVLDQNMKLVPLGREGELFIGGKGVARGYLNRPELTAEKFLLNPYIPNERLYRSGDLVRLNSDGELEYLGRIDKQVKIRGFRIELGEIESCLIKHVLIKEAIVVELSDEQDDSYLCAYVVLED
ncbi:non-ribosomal peptide synthetase, partial [Bacillus subtilis]